MTENTVKDTKIFACKSCGGKMIFDANSQGLKCVYCESTEIIESDNENIEEKDFFSVDIEEQHDWGNEESVIKCNKCGAKTVIESNIMAESCAFCGSSHVSKIEEDAGIIPESLIPFKLDKKKADEKFDTWLKKKFFIPKAAKRNTESNKLKGVYIPHWTYDTNTFSNYTAQAGHYYYVTVNEWVTENGERKQKSRRVRKTRWTYTSGSYKEFFDDVLINASEKMEDNILRKIQPFNLQELVKYKPEYLSGFMAEHYSIDVKNGWQLAKSIVDSNIDSGVRRKISADEIRFLNINTDYNNITYKHLLLPVWISTFKYKDKIYRCMINGQTGKVNGKIPLSVYKILFTILGALGGIAIIIFILINMGVIQV